MALNDTRDRIELTDIYRICHQKEAKYAFFSKAHKTYSKLGHMIRHKTSVNKFKIIEIISRIFLDDNGLKLKPNPRNELKNSKFKGTE